MPPETTHRGRCAAAASEPLWGEQGFGEAVAVDLLGRGLSGIAIRIGAYDAPWFHERGDAHAAMAYVSARDLNDLLVRCVETEDIPYAVVAGHLRTTRASGSI